VTAIIQARMGSSRLPDKMMSHLAGRPLIDHVIERLESVCYPHGPLSEIIFATSDSRHDDPLAEHVRASWPSINVIRGPEDDVLARFVMAAKDSDATTFLRITGDCPLLNVQNLNRLIKAHTRARADITNYKPGFEYVDKGIEVVSPCAILKMAEDPRTTDQDREHVTSLMYRYPEEFTVNYVDSEDYLKRGDIRITIDTREDLQFMEALCRSMNKPPVDIELKEAVDFLDHHPELLGINASSGRKSTLHERIRIGFRCDGGIKIGLGHVSGCLRLAHHLAKQYGVGIEFLSREDPNTSKMIKQAGFAMETLAPGASPSEDITRIIEKSCESDWAAVVINFCKEDLDRYAPQFERLKESGQKIIFMDNPVPPSYRLGDLLINALPHPDYEGYEPNSHPDCLDGLEFLVLDKAFTEARDPHRVIHDHIDRVLIAMGGADSSNVTGIVLEGLARAQYQGYADVVLGAACPHEDAIRSQLATLGIRGEISRNVNDLPDRIIKADLGFSALGLTTYEMAYLGLPVMLMAGSPFNAHVANIYAARYDSSVSLGCFQDVTPKDIACTFLTLNQDPQRQASMSRRGRDLVGSKSPHVFSRLEHMLTDHKNIKGKT
jgi:spore coat polysaccharide biosynthesis protein SpsF